MSTAKHDKVTSNSTKLTDNDTRKVINQTFDDAKNKPRKAIAETHRELPRFFFFYLPWSIDQGKFQIVEQCSITP
jgi:hypothetical protein